MMGVMSRPTDHGRREEQLPHQEVARPERPIFIVGSPRSGTGLLRNMIRAHPRISIPGESHFIPHFYKSLGDPRDSDEAVRLGRRMVSFSRVRRWKLDIRAEDFSHCRSYADAVDTLFLAWSETESRPRWGDKTPHYVRHIATLVEIFPEAQVIHIIRDPRPAANSWRRHPQGSGNHHSAALLWRRNVSLGQEAGARLESGQYREVRYERLLVEPDSTMRGIFEFLGESIPDELVKLVPPSRDHPYADSNISELEVVPANAEAWRQRMKPVEIQRVESVAGDLMEQLGYEPIGPRRPSPPIRSVIWRMQAFVLHYVRMFKRLGKVRDNLYLLVGRLRRPGTGPSGERRVTEGR